MNKIIAICFLFIYGCASMSEINSLSPNTDLKSIPKKSEKIIVTSNSDLAQNFSTCMKFLILNDFEITTKDAETGYILAQKKSQFDTFVKLNISFIDKTIKIVPYWKPGSSSVVIATAFSGIGGVNYDFEPAIWTNSSLKPCIAFLEADKLAKSFNGSVKYIYPVIVPEKKDTYWAQ